MGDIRSVPALFDGVGKQYPHKKACYYFFAWALRDAPVQRLQQLIARAKTTASPQDPLETEAEVLAHLFVAYRNVLGNFDWAAVREVIIDRLEGSRRAIRGHQKEAVVRTALTVALQTYFKKYGSYGRFDKIKVLNREVHIDTETFDVCVELIMPIEHSTERILIPVKTRETEGGGHSHLFTRDITSAITTAKASDTVNWVAVFIIAENWSQREQDRVTDIADFAVALKMSPGDFETVDDDTQQQFGEFVAKVLDGSQKRK